jgi:hypothetical protein
MRRSNPESNKQELDCFVASAPRNDGFNAATRPSTSLRANGSRERAPDDRLREAIQKATKEDWIASSQALLAMTALMLRPDHQRHCELLRSNPEKQKRKTGLLRRKSSSQ